MVPVETNPWLKHGLKRKQLRAIRRAIVKILHPDVLASVDGQGLMADLNTACDKATDFEPLVIVKGCLVRIEKSWWLVHEIVKGSYLRCQLFIVRKMMFAPPKVYHTFPMSRVEDVRIAVNRSFNYKLVRHPGTVFGRKLADLREVEALNYEGSSTRQRRSAMPVKLLVDDIKSGSYIFRDRNKKVFGLREQQLVLQARINAVKQRQEAIEDYYRNPARCTSCGAVILLGDRQPKHARSQKLCSTCLAERPARIQQETLKRYEALGRRCADCNSPLTLADAGTLQRLKKCVRCVKCRAALRARVKFATSLLRLAVHSGGSVKQSAHDIARALGVPADTILTHYYRPTKGLIEVSPEAR
jgi:hypothetical protein